MLDVVLCRSFLGTNDGWIGLDWIGLDWIDLDWNCSVYDGEEKDFFTCSHSFLLCRLVAPLSYFVSVISLSYFSVIISYRTVFLSFNIIQTSI
mmetsp:Transcript_14348/g.16127  ORF Transcript_14348/g.16127 Transcript_14348/m.16127 type:complete len:93 (-) Transcript_14348:274-552(-)